MFSRFNESIKPPHKVTAVLHSNKVRVISLSFYFPLWHPNDMRAYVDILKGLRVLPVGFAKSCRPNEAHPTSYQCLCQLDTLLNVKRE